MGSPVPTAYLDTCIVSGLAKEDLPSGEQQALLEVLRRHKEGWIKLITSFVTKQEIDRVPEQARTRHEVIYSLLSDIPRAEFSGIELFRVAFPGSLGVRQDPLYTELKQLLPGVEDAQHVFQAIKNKVDYFVTTDDRTILRYKNELESTYGIKAVTPSQLLRLVS